MINIHKQRSRKEQQILMNTTEKVELALLILRYVYTGQFSKRGVFRSLGSALCQSGPRQHKWKTTTSELFWGGSARTETESAEISRLLRVINQLLSSSWDFLQITVSSSGFIWKEDIGASDPPDKSSCSKCVHGSVFIPCPWRLTHWNKLLSPQIESNISLLQKHQFERLWLVCTAWTICSSCSVSSVRHLWHVFLWCVVVITARAAVWAAGRWPSLFCWQILLDIWDT